MIDWTDSKTPDLELWKNPLISCEDALEIADGAIAFRNEIIKNLRNKVKELDDLLTSASEHCNAIANERNNLQAEVFNLKCEINKLKGE